MKVATMRRWDRWLGAPVCSLLTLFRKLLPKRPPVAGEQPRRILFVKLAEMGSTVLAQDAIEAAIRRVGRENVFFLLFLENRAILDLMDLIPIENVVAIDARGIGRAVVSAMAVLIRLWKAKVEAAVDLEFFARSSAALCFLSGARWRAGYHAFSGEASYRGDLMTHRVSFNPYLHTSQTFRILVEALDRPPHEFPKFDCDPPSIDPDRIRFQPTRDELAEMRHRLREQFGKYPNAGLILLNANASDLMPLRRWPSERYVELARRLLVEYPTVRIAFTGAPGEAAAVRTLAGQVGSDRCISLAGQTTLRQLLVLYCLADVLVTNDSGPAHFASLTPIDVVVLFGPETPRLFAAPSPRTHPLWAGLACSPCINAFNDRRSPCTDNVCMQRIPTEQVLGLVRQLFEARCVRSESLEFAA